MGATPRRAVADLARTSAARALVPALDQTRNLGLVVLPGANVGPMLAGASPAEAGRVQFLVLLDLLVTAASSERHLYDAPVRSTAEDRDPTMAW